MCGVRRSPPSPAQTHAPSLGVSPSGRQLWQPLSDHRALSGRLAPRLGFPPAVRQKGSASSSEHSLALDLRSRAEGKLRAPLGGRKLGGHEGLEAPEFDSRRAPGKGFLGGWRRKEGPDRAHLWDIEKETNTKP